MSTSANKSETSIKLLGWYRSWQEKGPDKKEEREKGMGKGTGKGMTRKESDAVNGNGKSNSGKRKGRW